MLRSFRYRFYPTREQEALLRRTLGCVRLIYNKALHECSEAWHTEQRCIGVAEQDRHLTAWKKLPEFAFLNDVSSVPLQQALRHLHTARQRFFKKTSRYPRFKKKRRGGAAEFTRSAFVYAEGKVTLAKTDAPLDIRWSRPLPVGVTPSSITVILDAAGRWHVTMRCDDSTITALAPVDGVIGIDLGLATLATLSTGEKIANPRFDEEMQPRKRTLSRRLARKKKGSRNREKARLKLARLHASIVDRRKNYLHQLSTRLVRENQTIVVESLGIRGLLENRRLSRAIGDAGWGAVVRQLEYKSRWYGRKFVKVDPFLPSTKICSCCGFRLDALPLSARVWRCPACSAEHDRDVNAARNVLAAGLAVTACGPDVSHRVPRNSVRSGTKQEVLGVS